MIATAVTTVQNPPEANAFYARAGCALAVLWTPAALPDVLQTFLGNRVSNDISFTPGWLKGIRDVLSFLIFVYATRRVRAGRLILRVLAVLAAATFVVIGLSHGAGFDVAVRGVLCIPVIAWTITADLIGARNLRNIARGLVSVLTPVAIITSLLLGLFGAGMYFEAVGPYQRNPGLFLSPSATAFWAASHILLVNGHARKEHWAPFILGLLSMSGIFYINMALLFGKLKRWIYFSVVFGLVLGLAYIGVEGLINLATVINVGVRSSDAISITLITRLAIINESISGFTLVGNFPRGLNVATNQGLDAFFPDNAFLAAAYAYGVAGLIAAFVMMVFAFRQRHFGIFILMFTTSFFYVWFENLLFAGIAGAMMNSRFWDFGQSSKR